MLGSSGEVCVLMSAWGELRVLVIVLAGAVLHHYNLFDQCRLQRYLE